MAKTKTALSFYLDVAVEQRKGYFAASTKPFAITVYGKTEEDAEHRALKAVGLLLRNHSKTLKELSDYLGRFRVKNSLETEETPEYYHPVVVRECRQEMRLEVPSGV